MRRALSAAVVGGGALALCLLAPAAVRAAVILAGALLAAREALPLSLDAFAGGPPGGRAGSLPVRILAPASLPVLLAASLGLPSAGSWSGLVPGAGLVGLGLAALLLPRTRESAGRVAAAVLAAVWIGLPAAALLALSGGDSGGRTLLFLLAVVMVGEAGAYGFGKLIGGPRLAPNLSPGKTWAGFVAQLAVGAGVGALAGPALLAPAPGLPIAAVLGVFLSAAAALGDLFASWWKRTAGTKDAGTLIPGHGGFLDRVDGILFAAVAWTAAAAFLPR